MPHLDFSTCLGPAGLPSLSIFSFFVVCRCSSRFLGFVGTFVRGCGDSIELISPFSESCFPRPPNIENNVVWDRCAESSSALTSSRRIELKQPRFDHFSVRFYPGMQPVWFEYNTTVCYLPVTVAKHFRKRIKTYIVMICENRRGFSKVTLCKFVVFAHDLHTKITRR